MKRKKIKARKDESYCLAVRRREWVSYLALEIPFHGVLYILLDLYKN